MFENLTDFKHLEIVGTPSRGFIADLFNKILNQFNNVLNGADYRTEKFHNKLPFCMKHKFEG